MLAVPEQQPRSTLVRPSLLIWPTIVVKMMKRMKIILAIMVMGLKEFIGKEQLLLPSSIL